jgi:hypothetical protein
VTERRRLTLAQVGEWNIDIADVEIDHRVPAFEGCIAGDIPRGFAVAYDVEEVRPDLGFCHAQEQVKECTISGFEIMYLWCEPCSSLGHEIDARAA